MHNFFLYVYFYSVHVSDSHVPIIRRVICINATPGICHSVWMTVWYAGWIHFTPTCIPDGHPHRVTYTRCRIDTIDSPDAQNMYRIEINISENIVHPVGLFTKIIKKMVRCLISAG